jgi:hypothetical protein
MSPLDSYKIAALRKLEEELMAILESAKAKMPEGTTAPLELAEVIIAKEVDALAGTFATLRSTIIAELVALITTGGSTVRHDPTELA